VLSGTFQTACREFLEAREEAHAPQARENINMYGTMRHRGVNDIRLHTSTDSFLIGRLYSQPREHFSSFSVRRSLGLASRFNLAALY
jgi:hypothetical protein